MIRPHIAVQFFDDFDCISDGLFSQDNSLDLLEQKKRPPFPKAALFFQFGSMPLTQIELDGQPDFASMNPCQMNPNMLNRSDGEKMFACSSLPFVGIGRGGLNP